MTWVNVHNRYESKIRIENDQVDFPSSAKGRKKNKEKSKEDFDTNRRSSRGLFCPMNGMNDATEVFDQQIGSLSIKELIAVETIDHCWTNKHRVCGILPTPSCQNTISTLV